MLSFGGRTVQNLSIGCRAEVDGHTGAASVRIAVPVGPGRDGLAPSLSLAYSSGAGNSAFGSGWSLAGLSPVTLSTRQGIPRWDGTDSYQLGGDDLVPWLREQAGTWGPRGFLRGDWSVAYYRPRGSAARVRIEKWLHVPTGRIHFRTRDAANLLTIYGMRPDAAARVADPADESRTLAWLPELQIDTRGNVLWLEYLRESTDGINRTPSFEQRSPALAQRYLKRVRYGNRAPLAIGDALLRGSLPAGARFCFQVVLDYGDHSHPTQPAPDADQAWPARPDAFSSFCNGFEIRTYRLCRRFLSFHEFDEIGSEPRLIEALSLTHDLHPSGSTLRQVELTGYRYRDNAVTRRSIPPLKLSYAPTISEAGFNSAPASAQENVPGGLAVRYELVDLLGDGLPGILTQSDRAWYFKANRGGGQFAPQTLVEEHPAARLGAFALGDVDRDGDTELSQLDGRSAGSYRLDRETGKWRGFVPFAHFPHVEALGPNAQWVDLNGDGRPDVVISQPDSLVWFASDGDSFLPPVEISRPRGAHSAPKLAADAALDFFFADMTGDGLADLVRVSNGCVEYWPSLGNGRFADAVVMEGTPRFASDDTFDASRVRLIDLDGSGTTDIVYIGHGEVSCWVNANGNALVPGPRLTGLPYFDNLSSVRVLDFLGTGHACLVWSSPLPGRASTLEYLRLWTDAPPRLLLSLDDSRGRLMRFTYSSSAQHYLRDVESGRGWSTRLPNHHPVVDSCEVLDLVGKTRTFQRFEYHDGHYDGIERESRGFGQVDTYDTQLLGADAGAVDAALAAPALTRSWFHLGTARWDGDRALDTYKGDAELPWLDAQIIEDSAVLTSEDVDEGLRALAGALLRTETYAVDERGEVAPVPFEVVQSRYLLRRQQPARGEDPPAFLTSKLESAHWTYEQSAGDPRVVHDLAVDLDDFGRPLRTAVIAYPRRAAHGRDVRAQGRLSLILSDSAFVTLDTEDRFECGIPTEEKRHELAGVQPGPQGLITREQLRAVEVTNAIAGASPHHLDLPDAPGAPVARLLSWDQSFYWNDARDAALPLGEVGALTLAHHERAACFAPGFVADVLAGGVDAARLLALGYQQDAGLWWQTDAVHRFGPAAAFSQRVALERSDGARTQFGYDPYALTIVSVTDPLDNVIRAEIDYHQLAPWRLIDANGNVGEARYDPLGVITTSTRYGHVDGEPWGFDALEDIEDRHPADLEEALADPALPLQGAARYVWYDLEAWKDRGSPTPVLSFVREHLLNDGEGGGAAQGRIQIGLLYLDALGRPLQEKLFVEPGPAIQRDAGGAVVVDAGGRPVLAQTTRRWRASGHVLYDARQRPVRKHEPFFTPSSEYEGDDVVAHLGSATLNLHDALGRPIGQQFANGTLSRVEIGPWSIEESDANDTVLASAYRAAREGLPADHPERRAYEEARAHAGTSRTHYLDALGRQVGTLRRGGGTAEDERNEVLVDVEGQVREVIDGRGLSAFGVRFDMLGRVACQRSIDAGESRTVMDSFNRPVLTRTARGFEISRAFDIANRPLFTEVRGGDGPVPLDHRIEEFSYGESLADRAEAIRRNLLGQVVMTRDSASQTTVLRYSPGGTPHALKRVLRASMDSEPDWRGPVDLETEEFTTKARFDALGRRLGDRLVDGTERSFEYLQSGALARVRVTTPDGALTDETLLDGVEIGARGERLSLAMGNGVEVEYTYDTDTARLATQTARLGGRRLQQIAYTYDPVGNIVRLEDSAQEGPNALISGVTVPARREYLYDAHYRLREAHGRVHQALLRYDFIPGTQDTVKGTRHLSLNNGAAVERFTRRYDYDAAGNLKSITHNATSQNWVAAFWISATSNRSSLAEDQNGVAIVNPEGQFDAAGNMRTLTHLRQIEWNWRNNLARAVTIARVGGTDDAERYAYGVDGLRVRKVATRLIAPGLVERTEKIYLGDAERKRIWRGNDLVLERWTCEIGDGKGRLASVHRWTMDEAQREIDAVPQARIHYLLNTHQGSSVLELDEQGSLISYEEYFPYGATAFRAGDDLRGVERKDYRYSGKECDAATGLYCYGYRYYAPWIARWLSPDPGGPADAVNLYQFVLGDPVGNVDEMGLETKPGEIIYLNRTPPAAAASVEGKVIAYRERLGKITRQGFDTLSHDDKVRLVTTGGWLVPKDPRAETGSTGWAVIDDATYKDSWLPARQEWARKKGTYVNVHLFSNNPNRLAGLGGGGGEQKDESSPSPPSEPGAGGKDKDAKDGSGGGGGQGKDGEGGGGKAKGAGQGDGNGGGQGEGQGEGQGTGAGGGGRKARGKGEGSGSGGSGKRGSGSGGGGRLRGVGTEVSDVYGDFGGSRGGAAHGMVGGTPYSPGHTPGGTGGLVEGGVNQGAGRGSGGMASNSVSGAGARGPSGTGGPAPSGVGRQIADTSRASESANGPARGHDGTKGQGHTGKKQDGQSSPGGIKDVLLDIAGMTNFVFSRDENGEEGGVPGGLGWLNLKGSFFQWLYIATSIVSFITMITGIGELLAGIKSLASGLFRLGKMLLTDLPGLLRLGLRAVTRVLSFGKRQLYAAFRAGKGLFSHNRKAILEAFKAANHTPLSRAILEAIQSGELKVVFRKLKDVGGRAGAAGIQVDKTMHMEDVLTVIVHEGQHTFDIARGIIPELKGLSEMEEALAKAYGELRAFSAASEFAAANGYKAAEAAKHIGMTPKTLLLNIIDSYKVGNKFVGDILSDEQLFQIVKKFME